MANRTAEYYRGLPYTRRVRTESDPSGEYFVAFVAELPGVEADGTDPTEALYHLSAAFEDYILAMIEWGDEIPEPLGWPQAIGWDPAEIRVAGSASVETVLSREGADIPPAGVEPRWLEVTGGTLVTSGA